MKVNFLVAKILVALVVMTSGLWSGAGELRAEAAANPRLEAAMAEMMQPPRYGEDSVACVRNWSLYAEYFRQGSYKMAYEPWRYMFEFCPVATQNIYIHGATLIKFMFQQETDPSRREAWVDTLMMLYDQRIRYFGREGFVLGRKAADLYTFSPNNVQKQYDISERSIQLEGNASQADVLLINFQSAVRLIEAGLKEALDIVPKYDRAMDIIEYNLINKPQDSAFYVPSRTNIEILFEPYTSCENLITIFGPRFESNPEDPELLDRITDMLEKSGCTDSELFFRATKNLHRLRPTAQSAFLMGRLESNQENHTQAIRYWEQAIELYSADESGNFTEELFRTYMLMADAMHRGLRRFPQARTYYLAAAEVKPGDGRPFLLIGEMYAASAADCGTDEVERGAVYWAAVDKFIRARNIDSDPNIVARANQSISTWSQYFPSLDILFFNNLETGEAYRVGCWINENTTVRARP